MPERYPPRLTTDYARQGEAGGPMRVVLTLSLVGVVVVLAALLVWWSKAGQAHLPASVTAPSAVSQPIR